MRQVARHELLHNEGLEQFNRHFLRQSALVNLHFRAYDDNRTAGIIDTLTEQVLTETSLLTLEQVGERLERAVTRAGDVTFSFRFL